MKATLLAGLCLVLAGVIVGLASPRGSLTKPFEGVLVGASSGAPRETAPVVPPEAVEAAVAPATQSDEPLADADAMQRPYERAELTSMSPLQVSKAVDPRCAVLIEAARESYLSAGYATQEFASLSIAAKADSVAAANVPAARDRYVSAMQAARARIVAASDAQCWSQARIEPPDIGAFAASLPSAASDVLTR